MVAQNVFCTHEVKKIFYEEKIAFDGSFDATKGLQQIEIPDLLDLCAPCSEQPSNISTMIIHVSLSGYRVSSSARLRSSYISTKIFNQGVL